MRTAYKKFIFLCHKIGLNRLKALQNIYDFLKEIRLPIPLMVQGVKMKRVPLRIYIAGIFEQNVTNLCKRIVRRGWLTVDLGAQYGYHSLLLAKLVGAEGKVFAFEPAPASYEEICRNIKINNFHNIIPIRKAAGEREGVEKFFIPRGRGIQGFYKIKENKGHWIAVEIISLDEFFKDYLGPIHLIKIDVEGAELRTLQGMKNILLKNPDVKIIIELSPKVLDKIEVLPQEFFNQLRKNELQPYWIEDDGTTTSLSDEELTLNARKKGHINIFCSRRTQFN